MKSNLLYTILLSFLICVVACSNGGSNGNNSSGNNGGNNPPPVQLISTISGNAVKGPIDGAAIQLFYFGADGELLEIAAVNAPVTTDTEGAFSFTVNGTDLMEVDGPLIIRSSGGSMYGDAAPTLEAIISDPLPLTYNQVNVNCHLSTASSVAAGLLQKLAEKTGVAPGRKDAQQIIARVENQLHVDLTSDPSDNDSSLAMFNECVDQNLDLINAPANNPAVDEFISYLVANLSSSSLKLDSFMDNPSDPGSDAEADFAPFGNGALAGLVPLGPADFTLMYLASDRQFIENDGQDSAMIATTLYNALGEPSADLNQVLLGMWEGPGNLYAEGLNYGSGQVRAELFSPESGDNIIRTEYTLLNGNTIVQQIVVRSVDLTSDADGDGFSDGEEQMGWTITVDALGYGSDAAGNLMVKKTVTSDPELTDTDGDGLDDYTEYLNRTDPRSADTDGDGLTDAEELNRWHTSPTSVDSDGDARGPYHNLPPKPELFDGNELSLLSTSPTLEDTDGDGWTDYEEFDHPSRSPKVADLPQLNISIEDQVDVRLDVQYAESTGQTSQYGATLTKSNTTSSIEYDSSTVGESLKISGGFTLGKFFGLNFNKEHTFSTSETVAFMTESSKTAQSAYSEYSTDARTHTETAASGSMSMGVRLQNTGNISYTITQLGITARQWIPGAFDPNNPDAAGAFSTIATLVPALGGGLALAPGSTSPVLQLQVSDINADKIKGLLARPDSLRLEPAYYELENAEGLNFAYLEEITGPRTASLLLDYGDGQVEEYRVAALVNRNSDGTFAGVTLGEIMNDILSVPYETRPRQFIDPNASTNEKVLYSVRGLATVENNLNDGYWSVFLPDSASAQSAADFEDLTVHGGEQVILAYMKDVDGDGLTAPEEQYYRTDDTASADTDGDGLTDAEEVRDGWTVNLPTESYYTTSDPTEADQDGDGLNDLEEKTAGTDPTLPDTDHDGLRDGDDPHPLYPARVLHVSEGGTPINDGLSWATAMGSLSDALQEAKNGNASPAPEDDVAEIWVSAGRYVPTDTDDRAISFELSPNIKVYGGFSGAETKLAQRSDSPLGFPTFLSGDLLNNDAESYDIDPDTFSDNSIHVVQADETIDRNTVLDGFYILGGNADNLSNTSHDGDGGGMLSLGNPTLRNLFFRTNRANHGAGLFVGLTGSQGKEMSVTDCLFNRNVAFYEGTASAGGGGEGGGMYYSGAGSMLTIEQVEFRENESWGGAGIWLGADLSADIRNSVFDSNDARHWIRPYNQGGGGGLSINDTSTVRIDRCRFTRNEATYGSGLEAGNDSKVQINQTFFWENIAHADGVSNWGGGALYFKYTDARIINSTIADNRAVDDGTNSINGDYGRPGGIYSGLYFHIENSIIYGNTWQGDRLVYPVPIEKQQIMTDGSLDMRTSDIQGMLPLGLSGNGNIDADPGFVDGNMGNLNLKKGSACIDTGSNYVDYEPLEPGFQSLPDTDAAGNPRIVDGNGDGDAVVDMGPFEYQGE